LQIKGLEFFSFLDGPKFFNLPPISHLLIYIPTLGLLRANDKMGTNGTLISYIYVFQVLTRGYGGRGGGTGGLTSNDFRHVIFFG